MTNVGSADFFSALVFFAPIGSDVFFGSRFAW
jgi:hypothetical protein